MVRYRGRKKYMILGAGGENVFPEDIEAELNQLPGVEDSAVVGLEEAGKTVIHAVLLCNNCNGEAIIEKANTHLAPHQQIMEWSLWPEADFPRSATRKVKKEEVFAWIRTRNTQHVTRNLLQPSRRITPLMRVVAGITKRDPLTLSPETMLVRDLKLDSLLRIELVSRIEEELNVSLEEKLINPKTAIADLEKLVAVGKGRSPLIIKYPRWSLGRLTTLVRPFLQYLLFFSWLPIFARLKVTGLENLRDHKGPAIFMPNHRSYLDAAVVLKAMPSRWRKKLGIAAATDVLYKTFWWFAPLADMVFNSFPFPREAEENIKTGLEYMGRLIDNGWNVMIFPEGQTNRTNKPLLPLKGGTGVVAVEMQAMVVPIAIKGTDKVLPVGKFWPRRGKVKISFGKPIFLSPAIDYKQATEHINQGLLDLF